MRNPIRPYALALCALTALALVAGCADKEGDAEASASWSAIHATQEAEREAEAVQGAEQAVRDYFAVRAQCFLDPPNTDLSCLDEVAVDQQLIDDRAAMEWARETGRSQVGGTEVVGVERVVDVQLSAGTKDVTLSVCIDGSDIEILGPDGTPLEREDEQRVRYLFVVRKHVDSWQVSGILDDPEGEACSTH